MEVLSSCGATGHMGSSGVVMGTSRLRGGETLKLSPSSRVV